jgi:hypothetical protein
MRRRLLILLVVLAVGAVAAPAAAITNGVTDDGTQAKYPYVGQLLFYVPDEIDYYWYGEGDPGAWFTCTGTLIAENVVLTAGHCTYGVGNGLESTTPSQGTNGDGSGGTDIWINFSAAVPYDTGYPLSSNYTDNASRFAARVAYLTPDNGWYRGVAYPHPQYDDSMFFMWDLGIVQLTDGPTDLGYATLAPEYYLDAFIGSTKAHHRFTPVGYGLEVSRPWGGFGGDTRMYASVMLINTKGVFGIDALARRLGINNPSAVMSNDNGAAHQGGTCFGDSGGPVFDGDSNMIVAVTSFGMNGTCGGTGGVYRIDQPDDQNFIGLFVPPSP